MTVYSYKGERGERGERGKRGKREREEREGTERVIVLYTSYTVIIKQSLLFFWIKT